MTDIRQLWIDGFGCLRAQDQPFRFERQRINLFVDDNEAGKSTLQAAIVASLYGLETHRGRLANRRLRPHHDHWFPLEGPPFATRMRLHDGQRMLEVRWDFEDEDLHVVALDTNQDVTAEVCPGGEALELGRALLGLSFPEFTKTCLVRHDDLSEVRGPQGLVALVERAADSQAGDVTVARALEKLRGLLRNYPGMMLKDGGLVETEIGRLEEDAGGLRRRIAELDAEREAIAEDDREFRRLAQQRDELHRRAAQLDYLQHVAEHDELTERIAEAEKRRAELAEREQERDTLAHLQSFPADRAEWLTQRQTERQGLLREADEAEKAIAKLHEETLAPAQRRLEALGRLADVTQEDVDAVIELLGKTRDFEAREQRLQDAIQREERQLRQAGASIDELDRLEDRFRDLDPGDGEFLIDQERAAAQASSDLEEAKRKALETRMRADEIKDSRRRQREAAHRSMVIGGLVAGGSVVLGGILAALGTLVGALLFVGVATALAGLGAGGWLLATGRAAAASAHALQEDELVHVTAELGQLEKRQEELAEAQRERQSRLKRLASEFGYEQAEVLVEDYCALDDLRRLCGTLKHLRDQHQEMARAREALETEVAQRCAAYGREMPAGESLSAALGKLQAQMAEARRLRQGIDDAQERRAEESGRGDTLRRRAEELADEIRSVLEEAGVSQAGSIEEGIQAFNQRLEDYRRFRQLSDHLIPQMAANVADAQAIEGWKADLQRLHRAIANLREERPSLVSLEAGERSAEYRRQLGEVRAQLEELKAQADGVGRRVVDVLTRYHEQRPELEERLAEREAQLQRARQHKEAIELALSVLEEIGREVHGRWAEELNHRTSQLLERVVPTLSDLKFDSRLQFGVWHRDGETPVRSAEDSPILSAGTWDQLYLAVRLGLADFVAQRRGGGLVLLDDPFAHFDDERFERAFRVLAEMSQGRHQVIIFSCQRQRFKWLRERDREWFADHIVQHGVARARARSA
ncbi:MAG: AAA family ATPase [Candidatus Brocadiia bacterium]